MKRIILIFLPAVFLLPLAELSAQRKSDIGFMVGVPWYQGDISTIVPVPKAMPPALGPMFRYNFDKRLSLRAHGLFYSLAAEGEVFEGVTRQFEASFVDLGLDFEFNWWDYKTAWRKTKFSPYVSAGLGYSINYADAVGSSASHLYLPFGGGVKANLGKRMSGGIELSVRKVFRDDLDGVVNVGTEGKGTPLGNNDWYFFTGLFVSYKIFEYRDPCPAMGDSSEGIRVRSGGKRSFKKK